MAERKKLPIGVEFFREFKSDDFYYVDKTGFISELLRTRGTVNLFTRPRRFGKSLNMDMLKSFFEIGTDPSLFEGLRIYDDTELCRQYMGKYPVISISLKDVEGGDFETACDNLGILISEEASGFDYLMDSEKLTQSDKMKLQGIIEGNFEKKAFLYSSLKLLSRLLYKHYDIPVIILIDEYDVPLDKAHQDGYYPQMANLIRSLFSQLLKTNPNMYFAVITGCLRIARESIFTGLNHFKIRTISDVECAEYFGFTDSEVREMLEYYGVEDRYSDVKEWYDGYRFGTSDVYCPWDVVNQCDKFRVKKDAEMESHWENSSSNVIVQDIIENATQTTKAEIEALISGECVEKVLIPELTYTDLDSKDADIRQTYLWSVLFASGYLTDAGEPENRRHRLVIPNREVLGIYEKKIRSWFQVRSTENTANWRRFCESVKNGDAEEFQTVFNEFLEESISIRDTCVRKEMKENFYHGILLGLLKAEGSFIVRSNAESGIGYTDIMVSIPSKKIGCIIEVKYAGNGMFDSACKDAMRQIEDGAYVTALKQEGMQTIHKFGIACYKKSCRVVSE
jgi:hypothetical protein